MKVVGSTVLDVGIHMPMIYFPTYYLFRSAVERSRVGGGGPSEESVLDVAKRAWLQNVWSDMKMTAYVFVPIDLIMFGYVPLFLRTPFLAAAGLIWPFIMSYRRGRGRKER